MDEKTTANILAMSSCFVSSGETEEMKNRRLAYEAQEKAYLRLELSDAFEAVQLLGKSIEELAVPKEAVKYLGSRPFRVLYKTVLMGKPLEGCLFFQTDYTHNKIISSSFSISDDTANFMKCKDYLDAKLGEHHTSDATPYAAVNGGSVHYFIYYKDGYKYNLSHGSALQYFTLEISQGEPHCAPSRKHNFFVNMNKQSSMAQPTMQSSFNNIEKWSCPSCGNKAATKRFCSNCGAPRPATWICSVCGCNTNTTNKFCNDCGSPKN